MYDLMKEFIKPELLVLIPVLYLVGAALKRSAVADKNIPWILGAAGMILSYIWTAANSPTGTVQEILMCIFSGAVQGILAAGASVYVNQIVKQKGKEE